MHRYRRLSVREYDKHEGGARKRGGDKPDRWLWVEDSERNETVFFTDERGDDYGDFRSRADRAFFDYLNALAQEGWEILYYDAAYRGNFHSSSYSASPWPLGTHILRRDESGSVPTN